MLPMSGSLNASQSPMKNIIEATAAAGTPKTVTRKKVSWLLTML